MIRKRLLNTPLLAGIFLSAWGCDANHMEIPYKNNCHFPLAKVMESFGAGHDFQYESITWKGYQGYLITIGNTRLVCNRVGEMLALGDLISSNGENITRAMARHYKASTFISANAHEPLSPDSSSVPTRNTQASPGELEIGSDLFDYMAKLPGFDLGSPDGPLRLVIFTWESCPSCRAIKNILSKKDIPFRIREIPTGGTEQAENRALQRLGATGENREELLRRINDSTLIMKSLTGRIAVPVYAFRQDNGKITFGWIPAHDVLDRIKAMSARTENNK